MGRLSLEMDSYREKLFLIGVKARRLFRRTPRAAVAEFQKDVWGRGRAFDGVLALAVSYIGLKTASFPNLVAEANNWITFFQAFFYVVIPWMLYSLIRGPFSVIREDRAKARWVKHHRIYNEPLLIDLQRFEHNDGATQWFSLHFPDAEPGAVVSLKFECDPNVASRVLLFAHGGAHRQDVALFRPDPPNLVTGFFSPASSVGIRISNNRKLALYVRVDPQTVPMVLRVYCTKYFVGKGEGSAT